MTHIGVLPRGQGRPVTEHARTGLSLVVVSRPLIKPDRRLSEQERSSTPKTSAGRTFCGCRCNQRRIVGGATRVVTMPPDEQESRLNKHAETADQNASHEQMTGAAGHVAALLPQEAHADLGLIDADDDSVMWGGDDDAA